MTWPMILALAIAGIWLIGVCGMLLILALGQSNISWADALLWPYRLWQARQ